MCYSDYGRKQLLFSYSVLMTQIYSTTLSYQRYYSKKKKKKKKRGFEGKQDVFQEVVTDADIPIPTPSIQGRRRRSRTVSSQTYAVLS